MPSAPAARALSNASIVFSGACAESPRCAQTRGRPLGRGPRVGRPDPAGGGPSRAGGGAARAVRAGTWACRATLLDEGLVQRAHEVVDVVAVAPQGHPQRRDA